MSDIRFDVAGWPDPDSADELIRAHTHCAGHRDEILRSQACGCFSCELVFEPAIILEWFQETAGYFATRPDPWTAVCPRCGIDAVIGTASGFPANDPAFLKAMNLKWFKNAQN
ncbi:MAG: hypothetical protein ACRCSO_10870 [Sphingomonas sp.]